MCNDHEEGTKESVCLPAAPAKSRLAQRDAFQVATRRCEDATQQARSLPKDFEHRGFQAPTQQRRESTLRISLSSSKLISRPQTDDIAACRRTYNRGTFEMPIFQRKLQIGAGTVNHIAGIGAIS